MSTPLWMAIEPLLKETHLVLSVPISGIAMKARLPALPTHPRAVAMMLESISAWYRRPLTAAIDAEALGVQHHPERWCELLGDLPGIDLSVEWVSRAAHKEGHDSFFDALGDMRSAKRLATIAATGQR
jgi:hypothetical protein